MTRFLDVSAVRQLTAGIGTRTMLDTLATRMRADFCRWPEFDLSPRTAAHSEVGVIELMPVADRHTYAFKYVNGHPANTALGLPTVMAFGALADVATGLPRLVSELTLTTALRTAAASVMTAAVLARADARVMGMIGCGAQSEFQALAFQQVIGIDTVRIFDTDPAAMRKLARNLAAAGGPAVIATGSAAEAASGADIITTCTADKRRATILTPDMVAPGVHINALGGDCPGKTELHADVLTAARTFVEYEPQTRLEGDIQQLPADYPVTEIWQVLSGAAAGRRTAREITVFDSVGFALEDFSALCHLEDLARRAQVGVDIDLVLAPADPKDLFGDMAAGLTAALRAAR